MFKEKWEALWALLFGSISVWLFFDSLDDEIQNSIKNKFIRKVENEVQY